MEIIQNCKEYINSDNLEDLKKYVISLFDTEHDWPFLFQKVYLHACLKKRASIAEWLHSAMYPRMDPIQQIALRQIFPYGRYLLKK